MDGTSRVTGDCQARICEGLGVKFPGPTRRWCSIVFYLLIYAPRLIATENYRPRYTVDLHRRHLFLHLPL